MLARQTKGPFLLVIVRDYYSLYLSFCFLDCPLGFSAERYIVAFGCHLSHLLSAKHNKEVPVAWCCSNG